MALRVLIQVRLSVHRGDADPSTSPARQESVCRAYAAARGWNVVHVVRALDESGSEKGQRLARPGLAEIREWWDAIDVVIIAKLDRLARSVVDFFSFVEEAREHDVALVSVDESLDLTTPQGRFVATILAAFAEMEAAVIAQRVREGMAALRDAGRWGGGPAPYGYRAVPHPSGQGRTLELDPAEVAEIERMAAAVLDGTSLYAVAQDLNARGVPPRTAAAWSLQTVRALLVGESVLGRATHAGQVRRGPDGMPLELWPPALPLETAERLRAALEPRPAGERRTRAARLLSGLLACSSCGSALALKKNGSGLAIYACQRRSAGKPCAHAASVSAAAVEELIAEEWRALYGHAAHVVRVVRRPESARLRVVEEAIAHTTDAMRAPTADVAALATTLLDLRAERERLAALPSETVVELVPSGATLAEAWNDDEDVDARRALLSLLLDGPIVVHPGVRGRRGVDRERLAVPWREGGEADAEHYTAP